MQTATEKLRELRALHEDGLLSQQEYDTRKNAILDAEYSPPGPHAGPVRMRPATETGFEPGMEIGPQNRRYRLESLVATGGMGEVWQATDLATHSQLGHSATVAVKILPPHLTRSALHARLLIEEATQARQLAHENIVRVYEWARDPASGSYFIIMEYLEGEDLDNLLSRKGPMEIEHVLALLDPVARALDYAWEKSKLVHRDIKPGNVFITSRGEVKLLDFGIAARARAASFGVEAPAFSGTAGYRAPEAGTHYRQPARTLDVYAVAVMVYQMLQGRLPPPQDPIQKAAQPAGLNERQWNVLRRGFSVHAEQRPTTVRALLEELRRAGGPTEQELAVQRKQAREAEEARQREIAERRRERALAAAAARLELERQRKEQEARERELAEAARQERKEELRRQLLARRELEVAKARLAREEAEQRAAQVRAAAAQRAEHKRLQEEAEARRVQELAALLPEIASPAVEEEHVLRDRFIDGSGNGPELVAIRAGRFQMGSPPHERKVALDAGTQESWLAREVPQRWVAVEPFALGRYPVTVAEWRQFAQETGWQRSGDTDWRDPGFPQTDSHPVVGVTWDDARQYAAWLARRTGLPYRLPSEAEWEYACRAGTRTAFSFGDEISTNLANYDGNQSYNNSPAGVFRQGTTAAGTFPPNRWGLYDMHGNVWEWVQDRLHDNYEGAPLTGVAWEEGGDPGRRVLRGGSWLYNPRYLRSALRNGYPHTMSSNIVGFRVARDLT